MKFKDLLLTALLVVAAACTSTNAPVAIKTEVPARPAGQENVLGLTVPAMDTVRVGFVGLGMRGSSAVPRFVHIPGVKITALCDLRPEAVTRSQNTLEKYNFPKAAEYAGAEDSYKALCESEDVDLVYICTDWQHHVPVALYAMEHGKHVAIEVPAASSLEEIWALINMAEKNRLHCIMLENCCYDFFEMSCLAMAQEGLFGEILHVEGSYHHNLDEFWDAYWNNWRLDFNQQHKGDVYPTHGLGPVCQLLDIHRGDRMKTLVAMGTKSVNGAKHVEKKTGEACADFQNSDQTNTLITTENGKTILVEHNVMTPRPYSRMYQIVGTDGYASKYPVQQLLFRPENIDAADVPDHENLNAHRALSPEAKAALQAKYRNPILTPELEELAKQVGGHGGMDFIMDYRLIYCLRNGLPLDMDVYDMAEWCCITELGKISIENGNAPVEVPDFTRGAWNQIDGFSYAFAK